LVWSAMRIYEIVLGLPFSKTPLGKRILERLNQK